MAERNTGADMPSHWAPRNPTRFLALLAEHKVADNLDDYNRLNIPSPPYSIANSSARDVLESIASIGRGDGNTGLAQSYFGHRTLALSRREENRRRLRLLLHALRTEQDETRRSWVRQFLAEHWKIVAPPDAEAEERFVLTETAITNGYRFDLRDGGDL